MWICPRFGGSEPMRRVYNLVEMVAESDGTVLLTGESGTGKELVARAIHHKSARANGPFITLNCGALPENLFESELFGYDKGAFTGAMATKSGRFELAHEGTLLLDEVGELSLKSQVDFLRVLETKEFRRLGGTKLVKIDTRIIAATNRNLEAAVKQGDFREDLYYRLNVVPIHLPPLREARGGYSASREPLSDGILDSAPARTERGFARRHAAAPSLCLARQYSPASESHGATRGDSKRGNHSTGTPSR
jgi:transcriptional regulator with GAF, ATPase, and Fis domain